MLPCSKRIPAWGPPRVATPCGQARVLSAVAGLAAHFDGASERVGLARRDGLEPARLVDGDREQSGVRGSGVGRGARGVDAVLSVPLAAASEGGEEGDRQRGATRGRGHACFDSNPDVRSKRTNQTYLIGH